MEKMKMETSNISLENLKKLKEIFPDVFTETVGEDNEITTAIDAKKLEQLTSTKVIEGKECYDFTWVGKRKAMIEYGKPIRKTLRPCKEESVNYDKTENLYIEGDNLDVLKLFQNSYLNKIKMIYIDPPYNTGNDFIYKDDFTQTTEDYITQKGIIDDEGKRLIRNTEVNGKFHSDWCSMLYPRLKLARNLLTEDGVIFISIDDGELANVRKICDEIFGEKNFVTTFIWEKTQHFGRQKTNYYSNDDYIVCYAKNLINCHTYKLKELLVERIKTDLTDAPLFNASNNLNTLTFPIGCTKFNIKDGIYEKTTSSDYELITPVEVVNGKNANEFKLKFRSRWSNSTVQDEIRKGTSFWVKTENFSIRAIYGDGKSANESPRSIIFTNSSNPMKTSGRLTQRIDTSENSTSQLKELFDNKVVFSYPKPVSLIEYFISLLFNYDKNGYDNDFTILDFFAGSSTTAHSVMQLNSKDSGNRKFILVQLNENLDESLKKTANQQEKELIQNAIDFCDKLGKPHFLTEIGKECIRRAGKKIVEETSKKDLDIGFRVLKLDESNMKDVYFTPSEYNQDMLESLTGNIKEDRTSEDLLYSCMLEWGLELNLPIETKNIDGCNVHIVNGNELVACFDENVSEEVIKKIANLDPVRVVFRDSSFASDDAKINVTQIFKQKCPNMNVENSIKVL